MSSILVVISDTHIGSNTAIAPPEFEVHNRNTLEAQVINAPGNAQEKMRRLYGITCGQVFIRANTGNVK